MSTSKNSGDNGSGTIRHCVFIHFKPEISQDEKDAIYAEIDGLKNHVNGILKVMSGKNVDPKSRDHGFADGFIVDFVNSAVRDEYLENAEHKKVGAKIVAAAEGGPKGIFVFDMQL